MAYSVISTSVPVALRPALNFYENNEIITQLKELHMRSVKAATLLNRNDWPALLSPKMIPVTGEWKINYFYGSLKTPMAPTVLRIRGKLPAVDHEIYVLFLLRL